MGKEKYDNTDAKEVNSVMMETAVKMDNNLFNQFLKMNREKIDALASKNPVITRDDEWREEDFWDEDAEGKKKQ